MVSRRAFTVGLAATVVAGRPSSGAAQVLGRPAFEDLTGDLSRGDLFQDVIAAKTREEPLLRPPAVPGPFTFPVHTTSNDNGGVVTPRTGVLFGIDVSHYQGSEIRFDQLRQQNVRFVFAKASHGANYRDGGFVANWQSLGQLPGPQKVYRGAYHFLSSAPDDSPRTQADTFLSVLSRAGGLEAHDLPPVVDLQWDRAGPGGPDNWQSPVRRPGDVIGFAQEWLAQVEFWTGRIPMIYTSRSWWREAVGLESEFAKLSRYPLWIADHSWSSRGVEEPAVPLLNPNPPTLAKWTLWQFTASSRLANGYPNQLGASMFRGTEAEFRGALGVQPLPA